MLANLADEVYGAFGVFFVLAIAYGICQAIEKRLDNWAWKKEQRVRRRESLAHSPRKALGGDASSQNTLSYYCESGAYGVADDYVAAHAWLEIIRTTNARWIESYEVEEKIDVLATKMTSEQIAKAQSLSRTFRKMIDAFASCGPQRQAELCDELRRLLANPSDRS